MPHQKRTYKLRWKSKKANHGKKPHRGKDIRMRKGRA